MRQCAGSRRSPNEGTPTMNRSILTYLFVTAAMGSALAACESAVCSGDSCSCPAGDSCSLDCEAVAKSAKPAAIVSSPARTAVAIKTLHLAPKVPRRALAAVANKTAPLRLHAPFPVKVATVRKPVWAMPIAKPPVLATTAPVIPYKFNVARPCNQNDTRFWYLPKSARPAFLGV